MAQVRRHTVELRRRWCAVAAILQGGVLGFEPGEGAVGLLECLGCGVRRIGGQWVFGGAMGVEYAVRCVCGPDVEVDQALGELIVQVTR
ncbi:hypothetical protein [Streptomyces sp. NPDC058247]|uniref:hypothetical protein n=1 Tax=Streptomyces sp. NPDC058247 TaxID=3346401 RepID=UPI0036EB474D